QRRQVHARRGGRTDGRGGDLLPPCARSGRAAGTASADSRVRRGRVEPDAARAAADPYRRGADAAIAGGALMTATLPVSRAPYDIRAIRRDFPILRDPIHGKALVYLDNAA